MKPYFLNWLRTELRRFLGLVPQKPSPPSISGIGQVTMLRYTFDLPTDPSIDDFASSEANVTVNGGTAAVIAVGKDDDTFTVDFNRGDVVSITLVDIDTTGNRSEPSDPLEFTATDSVPPPKPGAIGVQKIEQV